MLLAGWGENGGSCLREICKEKKRSHQRFFLSNQCLLHKDIRKGLINMVHSLTGSPPDLQLPSASGSGLLTSTFLTRHLASYQNTYLVLDSMNLQEIEECLLSYSTLIQFHGKQV